MYSIKLTQIAADYITSLDQKSQTRILEKIEILKSEPLKVGKWHRTSLFYSFGTIY